MFAMALTQAKIGKDEPWAKMPYRHSTSHRWNGKNKLNSGKNRNAIQKAAALELSMGGNENSRHLVIVRASKRKSTTENQLFSMNRFIAGLAEPPAILDFTGTSWRRPIKEMAAVIQQVEARRWDRITLWRTDRIGRNHLYDCQLWDACKRNGCVLELLDDDLRSDRPDDEDKFYEASVAAGKERKMISKRVREAFARKREIAKQTGIPWKCGGGRPNRFSARIKALLPEIIDLLKLGRSVNSLATKLEMSNSTIRKIRRRYVDAKTMP